MRKNKVSTTQIIALGFVILVVVGGLLLMLPVASRDGQWTSLIDAMFTAGTSSCVTGLVVVNTLVVVHIVVSVVNTLVAVAYKAVDYSSPLVVHIVVAVYNPHYLQLLSYL